MSWRLAYALDELLHEVNERWPDRSKASDGTIGDQAHKDRKSDHNPNARGVVTAVDITDDRQYGQQVAQVIVDRLVADRDPRVKYVIFKGRIWRSYAKPGVPAWTPARYTGLNAHAKHVHVSVQTSPVLYDRRDPWGIRTAPSRIDLARQLLRKAREHRPAEGQAKIDAALEALEGMP